jgi:hypothetical protein
VAITSFEKLIGARKHPIQFSKVVSPPGTLSTSLAIAGFPAAGAPPGNTTTGVVPTDATTGFPAIDAFQGSNRGYLSRVEAMSDLPVSLVLFDVLFWAGATAIPNASSTPVTLGSQPDFSGRLPLRSDGVTPAWEEVEMWVWQNSATVATGSVTINYRDQDNNAAETSAAVTVPNSNAGQLLRVPWNAGDYGARLMDGYTVSAGGNPGGQVTPMFLRRIWGARVEAKTPTIFGPELTGLPRVFDTSALMLAGFFGSLATNHTINLMAEIAEG